MLSLFTPSEKKAIIFLFFLGFLSLGVNYFFKKCGYLKEVFQEDFSMKIKINEATKEELMSLPYIGERIAERIINYRQRYGRFLFPEDLKKIKGINKRIYKKIIDKIDLD